VTPDAPLDLLYKTYHNDLVRYAFSIVRDRQEAEDVVQEAFVRYWKYRIDSGAADNEKNFLVNMVHNKAVDRLRKKKTARSIALDDPSVVSALYSAPSESLFDKFCSKEMAQMMNDEISKLPPKCAEIFSMCRNTPMTYEEAARTLGISVSTVKTQMMIAMKRLYSVFKNI